MADDLDTEYDDSHDQERPYGDASVEGWQPPEERKFRKLLDAYRKANPSEFCRESLFDAKTARAWQRDNPTKGPPAELFGPLWRKGELAVLFGTPGAGKSILAVQIAESIARGVGTQAALPANAAASAASKLRSKDGLQDVIYFDFERSPEQFAERYRCPSPIPGKLPVKYRFSSKLKFARLANMEIPEIFQGNFSAYFEHSLALTIGTGVDKVIIVDNLEWLDIKTTSPAASIRRMRALKRCCMMTGTSVLVLHSVDDPRVRSPHVSKGSILTRKPIEIPRSAFRIFNVADSIFAIGHSTFAPDIRYVKPLKSNVSLFSIEQSALGTVHSDEVLTYQLGRNPGPAVGTRASRKQLPPACSPPARGGVALTSSDEVVGVADCFLGLTYLGPSNESDHLRDYAAEALADQRAHEREIRRLARRSAKQAMIEGMSDGSYQRYLKGE